MANVARPDLTVLLTAVCAFRFPGATIAAAVASLAVKIHLLNESNDKVNDGDNDAQSDRSSNGSDCQTTNPLGTESVAAVGPGHSCPESRAKTVASVPGGACSCPAHKRNLCVKVSSTSPICCGPMHLVLLLALGHHATKDDALESVGTLEASCGGHP